jgi:hypothetical protein
MIRALPRDIPAAMRLRHWIEAASGATWFWRLAGWAGVLGICVLSVVPGSERPHTGAPGQFEHMLAYALTGAALGLGYRRRPAAIVIGLTGLSGLMELVQLQIPGRDSQLIDVIASGSGAVIGTLTALLAARLARRGGRASGSV